MQGLRKQENEKFIKFFEMVQEEAHKKNCVFFLDCGLGTLHETEEIECEDLCGWLIPDEHVPAFETVYSQYSDERHNYDVFYCSVDYVVDKATGEIHIDIDDAPDDLIVDDFSIIQHETETK